MKSDVIEAQNWVMAKVQFILERNQSFPADPVRFLMLKSRTEDFHWQARTFESTCSRRHVKMAGRVERRWCHPPPGAGLAAFCLNFELSQSFPFGTLSCISEILATSLTRPPHHIPLLPKKMKKVFKCVWKQEEAGKRCIHTHSESIVNIAHFILAAALYWKIREVFRFCSQRNIFLLLLVNFVVDKRKKAKNYF